MTGSARITGWLLRWRWGLLAAGIGLTVWAWPWAQQVRFDRSVENMFAADDPLLVAYRQLKDEFGGNEIVLGVYAAPDLWAADGSGLERLRGVSQALREIAGVQEVLSLAEVNAALEQVEQLGRLLGRRGPPAILRPDNPLAAAFRQVFEGYTHDAAGRIAVLVCMLNPEQRYVATRSETIDQIRAVVTAQPEGMIAGEPVMVTDGFRYVEQDGAQLGRWTTILLAATIVLLFRSVRWVLIPVVVVQFALIMTRATMAWSNLRLSMVSSMLTAIVTVVGVATVVHVLVRFRQARARGLDQRAALAEALSILLVPTFWACATDAVGFASLVVARVGPVQDFGIMMSVGCGWVLIGVLLWVPGLALLGRWDSDPHLAWGEQHLAGGLQRLVRTVQAHPRPLAVGLAGLLLLALVGVFRLQVETDFTRNFRRGSAIVASYQFIERNLGGAGVWDVLVPAPATLTEDYLARVRTLENALRRLETRTADGRSVPALTKVLSLVDGLDATTVRPLLKRFPPELRARGMELAMPNFTSALRTRYTDSRPNWLRIMLRAREQQPAAEKSRLIAEVTRLAEEAFPPPADTPGAQVTGFYVLLTNLIRSMLRDQWICFGVATTGIGLMMWLAFRSLTLAVVALVPNVLPILLVLGGMGLLGVKINMGAAMIAAVSIGLSVDSSIHYTIAFRRARQAGSSVSESLHLVQQAVGRPIVFSTLALIVGFLALCGSQFVPTIYFGSLVGLSMLGGLLGNLIVLPLLLNLTAAARTG